MTALSSNYEAQRKDGELISYPVAASTHIYKGAMVCLNTSGYAVLAADTVSFIFIGIAYEEANNTTATNGDVKVRILKNGSYVVAKASAAQTDMGAKMCISDDNTVAADTAQDIAAGYVVDVPDSSHVRILIDTQVR